MVAVAPAAPSTIATTTAPLGAGVSYEAPSMPVRLIIPAIGVDANIQSVGMWWKVPTDMGIPTNFTDVGWYNLGPRPGEPGSAVIDGHLDGATVAQAVFYNLGKLQPGDSVEVVDAGGKTLHFVVVATKLFDYNATTTDIFNNDTSKARLNLITCAGDWVKGQGQYNQRVVVFTELAS
jgi:LPXTG-site transpeptidase (sortase) family protein